MKKNILALTLCVASLATTTVMAQNAQTTGTYHSKSDESNWNTKGWNAHDAAAPSDWDGASKPGSYPKGDNPKWYQSNTSHDSNVHNKYEKSKYSVKRHWDNTKEKAHEEKENFQEKHPKLGHPIETIKHSTE